MSSKAGIKFELGLTRLWVPFAQTVYTMLFVHNESSSHNLTTGSANRCRMRTPICTDILCRPHDRITRVSKIAFLWPESHHAQVKRKLLWRWTAWVEKLLKSVQFLSFHIDPACFEKRMVWTVKWIDCHNQEFWRCPISLLKATLNWGFWQILWSPSFTVKGIKPLYIHCL